MFPAVGDQTCLVQRLAAGHYVDSCAPAMRRRLESALTDARGLSRHTNTVGVDFLLKKCRVMGQPFSLQLWDTAGQERYRSLARQYFKDCRGRCRQAIAFITHLICLFGRLARLHFVLRSVARHIPGFYRVGAWVTPPCPVRQLIVAACTCRDWLNDAQMANADHTVITFVVGLKRDLLVRCGTGSGGGARFLRG